MDFKSITIKKAIDEMYGGEYLLPAIQREFVWSTEKIENLFDSLMRDYPINSFLFWEVEVKKEMFPHYRFYEFLREYDEYREQINLPDSPVNLKGKEKITAIIDGQQRLTALSIGLKGTYAYRLPRKRRNKRESYPSRQLCLNLLSPVANGDSKSGFHFCRKEEICKNDNEWWFVVGDILTLKDETAVDEFLQEKGIADDGKDKETNPAETLRKLHKVIHSTKSVHYFPVKEQDLDEVLKIFIRTNSGGIQLRYSDLLFSTATAEWKKRDARKEITSFVVDINRIGNRFNIDKDFVLKSCLVLADIPNIAFKVANFTPENMFKIEESWDKISEAIKSAFYLLHSFGYQGETLTSNNAVIPIAYYLYKIRNLENINLENYLKPSKYEDDKEIVFKWLARVLLKRTFSGESDRVLGLMKKVIDDSPTRNGFPSEDIEKELERISKSLSFKESEIDNLFDDCQYGPKYTFSVLAFLPHYYSLDFKNRKFVQDHIFPKKLFTETRLKKIGIPVDDIPYYLENRDCIANLQLLEETENLEKSDKEPAQWIEEKYPNEDDRNRYMKENYIPDCDLERSNFKEFVEERKKLMSAEFQSRIGIKNK